MKKVLLIFLSLVFVISAVALVACDDEETSASLDMFYKVSGYADTVYCLSENSMSVEELTVAMSLQGVLAQEKAVIYLYGSEGATLERINALAQKNGFEVNTTSSLWGLITKFKDSFGGKYVLYNDHNASTTLVDDQTINYATTIAGAESWVMVSKTLESTAKMYGLELGFDATAEEVDTRYVFETYKDKLNNSYLVHQDPTNRYLRDYAIAGKAMCFYSDMYDGDSTVKADILTWAKENAPILGWTANEGNFVASNSLQSIVTIAADHAANLSLYSADKVDNFEQSNFEEKQVQAEQGKHYVAIVMSDGDNVQWMTRGFQNDTKYYGSPYRGQYPITWTTSPALYDLAPNILSSLYSTATDKDLFIAGPSGVGYINAADYKNIESYAATTSAYMQATDLQYVNFLDNTADKTMLDEFAKYDQIKGGVWSIGDKYIEGEGAVYWSNGKPFVTARETLWRIAGNDDSNKYYGFVERVAQRINEYSTDCTKIEGYTVVLAHVWSVGSMDYINRFVEQLDENVELVTVDQLIDMVSKNVEHKDAFPDDIKVGDLDDNLCPIQSEQYIWNDIKNTHVTNLRNFVFDSEQAVGSWHLGNGGLQYDKSYWVQKDTAGKPAILLDGSDLDDVIDPLPNSWIYNRFSLSAEQELDNYLYLFAVGGENADVNMRVRAIYEQDGKMKSVVLNSKDYAEGSVDQYGWYKRNSRSPRMFEYDISQFKGKKVIISIEQDDTGDGTGELLYIERVTITDNPIEILPAFPNWASDRILEDWTATGTVELHEEGTCLEFIGESATISYTYTVTEQTKYAKFYVRKFVRVDGQAQDVSPRLQLSVNESVCNAIGATQNYVEVTTDEYVCIIFDLSAYVGQQVELSFTSLCGEHAAIGKIWLAESYQQTETTMFYTLEQLNQI